ncbi:hypothetical protein EON65_22820 [archaeon]|nr:MAG: hypothetical protein EON65_22820 [archaeon]
MRDAQDTIAVIERDLDIIELYISQSLDVSVEEREVYLTREVQDLKEDTRIKHLEVSLLNTKIHSLELMISQNCSIDYAGYVHKMQVCQEELDQEKQQLCRYKDGRRIAEIAYLLCELETYNPAIQINREALEKLKSSLHHAFKEIEDFNSAVQRAERETLNISAHLRHLLLTHDEDMRALAHKLNTSMVEAHQIYENVSRQTEEAEELQQQCKVLQTQQAHLQDSIGSQQHIVHEVKQDILCTTQVLADAKARLYNLQQRSYLLNMQIQAATNRNFVEKAENISSEAEALREQLIALTLKNEDIKKQVCILLLDVPYAKYSFELSCIRTRTWLSACSIVSSY